MHVFMNCNLTARLFKNPPQRLAEILNTLSVFRETLGPHRQEEDLKKNLPVCWSLQGLSIMFLLPLFKSLMHEVCTYMTERVGWGWGGHICVLYGGMEVLALFKQRFPQQPHAPLVPLIKTRGQRTSITPHSHAHPDIRKHSATLNPLIYKGVSTSD